MADPTVDQGADPVAARIAYLQQLQNALAPAPVSTPMPPPPGAHPAHGFWDQFATNLSQTPMPGISPYGSQGNQFLQALLGSTAQSWAGQRAQPIAQYQNWMTDERKRLADENATRIKAQLEARATVGSKLAEKALDEPKAAATTQDYDPMTGLPLKDRNGAPVMTDPVSARLHLSSFSARKVGQQGYAGFDPVKIAKAIKKGTMTPEAGAYSRGQFGPIATAYTDLFPDDNLIDKQLQIAADRAALRGLNAGKAQTLQQNVVAANKSLNLLTEYAKDLQAAIPRSAAPLLNRPLNSLTTESILGSKGQAALGKLRTQMLEVNSLLASVYQGGISPTDKSLEAMSHSFHDDMPLNVILGNADAAGQNLAVRKFALTQTQPVYVNSRGEVVLGSGDDELDNLDTP